MLLTLVYMITRFVLAAVTVVVRREVPKDVQLLVLRHENAVLRRHVKGVRYRPVDRVWLSALARLIPRCRWAQVFNVSSGTLLRWHRRLVAWRWTYRRSPTSGRPPTSVSVVRLVVAMAWQNPCLGGIVESRVSWPDWIRAAQVIVTRRCGIQVRPVAEFWAHKIDDSPLAVRVRQHADDGNRIDAHVREEPPCGLRHGPAERHRRADQPRPRDPLTAVGQARLRRRRLHDVVDAPGVSLGSGGEDEVWATPYDEGAVSVRGGVYDDGLHVIREERGHPRGHGNGVAERSRHPVDPSPALQLPARREQFLFDMGGGVGVGQRDQVLQPRPAQYVGVRACRPDEQVVGELGGGPGHPLPYT